MKKNERKALELLISDWEEEARTMRRAACAGCAEDLRNTLAELDNNAKELEGRGRVGDLLRRAQARYVRLLYGSRIISHGTLEPRGGDSWSVADNSGELGAFFTVRDVASVTFSESRTATIRLEGAHKLKAGDWARDAHEKLAPHHNTMALFSEGDAEQPRRARLHVEAGKLKLVTEDGATAFPEINRLQSISFPIAKGEPFLKFFGPLFWWAPLGSGFQAFSQATQEHEDA